jgi:regulator of RNase E activity RraA
VSNVAESVDESEETRGLLANVSTATIATVLFGRGLRNTVLHGLYSLAPTKSNMVGTAATVRYIPAREDIDVLDVYKDYDHPQRAAIEATPPGAVLVADCRGVDRAAAAGHILMTRLQVRGAAGFVSDGSMRDSGQVAELDMPVYVKSRCAMTNLAAHHAVDFNVPIGCAGVAIYPGDWLVGDADGVICIPSQIAHAVARECDDLQDTERFVTADVRNGAPLRNTYPPSEATRERYRAMRGR